MAWQPQNAYSSIDHILKNRSFRFWFGNQPSTNEFDTLPLICRSLHYSVLHYINGVCIFKQYGSAFSCCSSVCPSVCLSPFFVRAPACCMPRLAAWRGLMLCNALLSFVRIHIFYIICFILAAFGLSVLLLLVTYLLVFFACLDKSVSVY